MEIAAPRSAELGRPRRARTPPLARVAILGGLLLVIAFFGDIGVGQSQQQHLKHVLQQQLAADPPPKVADDSGVQTHPVDGVDFGIRVPKLGYFAAVAEGTDTTALDAGPGHYPDS